MPSRFSIAAKLYGLFTLLALVTVAVAAIAVINAQRHVALTKEFKSAFNGAENVARVDGLIYAVVMESRGIYMSPDIEAAKQFAVGLNRFNDQIGTVVDAWQQFILPEDAGVFGDFSGRVKKFQEFRRELVRRATEIGPAAGREWGDNDANRAVRTALNKDLETLDRLYADRSGRIFAQIENAIWATALNMALAGAAALLLAVFGAMVIHRNIATPLAAITRVTEKVAGGGAGIKVPYGDRGDEIGALARSISVFQDAMQRNIELSRTIASDADAKAQTQELIAQEIAHFGTEIESSLSEIGQLFDRMLAESALLTEVADGASTKTITATKASNEASANVGDIASAAEQLAQSVGEIGCQVEQSGMITGTAISEVAEGNEAVKQLNDAGRRIGDVIKLITDIAGQTNLLALNATIEAARAGEAGRGFSVVASEVKALSSQTARATDEIGAQIAAMQSATLRSVHAIESIERRIREIGEIAATISAAVTEQGSATQEIARSAEVAARHTMDAASEVEKVGEATENTRVSAKSVKTLADDLAVSAAKIRGQVDHFFQKLRAA